MSQSWLEGNELATQSSCGAADKKDFVGVCLGEVLVPNCTTLMDESCCLPVDWSSGISPTQRVVDEPVFIVADVTCSCDRRQPS